MPYAQSSRLRCGVLSFNTRERARPAGKEGYGQGCIYRLVGWQVSRLIRNTVYALLVWGVGVTALKINSAGQLRVRYL